jgi:hypothetical protein
MRFSPPAVLCALVLLGVMAAGCSLPLSDSGGVAAIASYSGALVSFLGPTVRNYVGDGSPIDGGFNAGNAMMVNGDAWVCLDVGKVQKNKWSGSLA